MTPDPRVHSCSLSEVLTSVKTPDLLIASASFEERCLSLPSMFSETDSTKPTLAICVNEDSVEKTFEHRNRLTSIFEDSNIFELSKSNPIKTADSLIDLTIWINNSHKKNILVDISCFTHESLLMLIKVLHEYVEDADITLAYVPAKYYAPKEELQVWGEGEEGENQKEATWLSKGLKQIRSVLGYTGDLSPSKDIHLVVLVGFDKERTLGLIEEYEPGTVSLGLGSETPIADHFLPVNKKFVDAIHTIQPGFETFDFSPSCPFQVADELEKIAHLHEDKNIVVAPMNTKLSTLGAIRALHQHPEIQACYTLPLIYNYDKYSVPSDRCMYLKLSELFS